MLLATTRYHSRKSCRRQEEFFIGAQLAFRGYQVVGRTRVDKIEIGELLISEGSF